MLNDGGSSSASAIGEKRILPYLKQRGIAALDAVVITHPDADHTNGILELLELIGEQKTALRIRHLFLPVWMKGSEKENPFILAAQKAGIMVEYLKRETRSVQENSPYRYFIRERAKTIRERKTPEVLYYSFPAVPAAHF